ncbi:hypothetical protein COS31_01790 [Candidatus Roizmanbacteria bacterium CG02_land_8_20_14_3_00_36_15]|uniref:Uncharacterized protein n=1 Tax=Candidatus Roizmanbacteria bacterium CG10_big_fil_rev_8_21_14_0_10_36_26 TaxID=1974851 RepID=A0A2M8KMD1_9BACT|nr:MAG: hypothetical protein COS51_05235 [Candidatus Roizmanbacteria bacterium CG03_land_8_20_14_0_80_36_21]PIV38030.1 MAG: hypothetical protein COS31_01790 [Candidatus Roizmanbacteria bacterium CG02_land_8_20_14_3_00_36_15]PIY69746.1 MAG: hypothetical protein COY89_04865 [Candidatus Roizmanbacteria bacterium CG_4_10_14_0_8_um_filter_36_36]PJA52932.1 MAG: hypothetical protein CO166_03685 [Candidatus Roizmanbacteria bacterium CG_4_9_14_3_um_filter_36_11]PJE61082.1 MAG: hypothetical protein COU86
MIISPLQITNVFNYVVPIPAGRLENGRLTQIPRALVKDAHDMFVAGKAEKVIFLGNGPI